MTMTLISTVTVGAGGASSIEFTGIPQTGTDLVVLLSVRDSTASALYARINSDSSANYKYKRLYGTGSAADTSGNASATELFVGVSNYGVYTANTFGNTSIYIPNYTSSNAKSISSDSVNENNSTDASQNILANSWSGTSAITSLSFFVTSPQTFAQYSTASLYTITKGSGGATVA